MIKCKAKEPCFHGGKRHRKGDEVMFDGKAADIPKHLEQVKETKGK